MAVALALLGLVTSCRQAAEDAPAWGPWYGDAETLAALAANPDVSLVHRDLALLCPASQQATHHVGGASCSVSTIGAGGALTPAGIEHALFVQRFDAERVLVGTTALSLHMLSIAGPAISAASGALYPRVADDRRHAAWVELALPAPTYELGAPTRVVLWDAVDDLRWVVSEDASDSSPIPVPGAREVLLISRRSGLASYWLVGPERQPTQLTNIGLRRATEGFVPLHAGELIWLPEQRRAVYSADYGEPELWVLDLDGGGARRIGPGRLPMLARGGGVLAAIGEGEAVAVVQYGEEELR